MPTPLEFSSPTLLCLGRLAKQKGFDIAIQAFSQVSKKFPHLRLHIAGDSPERANLENLAKTLGVKEQVTFMGYIGLDEIPAIMNQATLSLMPSRFESFGLVALHTAQMERPLIATKIDGLPEIVIDKETGLLIPAEDPEALAQAIDLLLSQPELAISMGKNHRNAQRLILLKKK